MTLAQAVPSWQGSDLHLQARPLSYAPVGHCHALTCIWMAPPQASLPGFHGLIFLPIGPDFCSLSSSPLKPHVLRCSRITEKTSYSLLFRDLNVKVSHFLVSSPLKVRWGCCCCFSNLLSPYPCFMNWKTKTTLNKLLL